FTATGCLRGMQCMQAWRLPGNFYTFTTLPPDQQLLPVLVEPLARSGHVARERGAKRPELRPVVHLLAVRDLVRDEVIHHLVRREQQPPGEHQLAVGAAAAPAGAGIEDAHGRGPQPEPLRLAVGYSFHHA